MRLDDHLAISEIVFGRKCEEVHKWLDETFPKYLELGSPFLHWKERHHIKAIKDKYKEDSLEYGVALLHVITDWMSHLRVFRVPLNEEEVVTELRRFGVVE